MRLPRLLLLPLAAAVLTITSASAPAVALSGAGVGREGGPLGPLDRRRRAHRVPRLPRRAGGRQRRGRARGQGGEGALRVRAAARHRGPHAGSPARVPVRPRRGAPRRTGWRTWSGCAAIWPSSRSWRGATTSRIVYANPSVRFQEPVERDAGAARAPGRRMERDQDARPRGLGDGFTGQGVVIGGQDTGYAWAHAALQGKYRGWNGTTADHNYNWHDAIHYRRRRAAAPTRPCRATTTATAPTPWARWSATTARATRSAWRRARSGSAAATWTSATARPRPTASASSGSSPPPNLGEPEPRPDQGAPRHQQLLGLPAQRGLHESQRAADRGREHARGRASWSSSPPATAARAAARVVDPPAIYGASFSVGSTTNTRQRRHLRLQQPRPGDHRRQQPPEAQHLGARGRASVRASAAAATAA